MEASFECDGKHRRVRTRYYFKVIDGYIYNQGGTAEFKLSSLLFNKAGMRVFCIHR